MISVATNLAHDGVASPVSILENNGGRGSFGVNAPLAVVIDLEAIKMAPRQLSQHLEILLQPGGYLQ